MLKLFGCIILGLPCKRGGKNIENNKYLNEFKEACERNDADGMQAAILKHYKHCPHVHRECMREVFCPDCQIPILKYGYVPPLTADERLKKAAKEKEEKQYADARV